MPEEKLFRRITSEKRSQQFNPFDDAFIVADPDGDIATAYIVRSGHVTVIQKPNMLRAMSEFGDQYVTKPMSASDALPLLAAHAKTVTQILERSIKSFGPTEIMDAESKSLEEPKSAPPPNNTAIAVEPKPEAKGPAPAVVQPPPLAAPPAPKGPDNVPATPAKVEAPVGPPPTASLASEPVGAPAPATENKDIAEEKSQAAAP